MAEDLEFRQGDSTNNLLRKMLGRLKELVGFGSGSVSIGDVTLTASDLEIGAVELKDADTDTRAKIRASDPGAGDNGIVVRNIPSGTQPVSAASLPLPTGAATEASLATRLSESAFQARINTLGQKTMANSTPVVIAGDQSALAVSVNNFPAGSGDGAILDGDSAAIKATVFDLANANPLATRLVDGNGDPVSVGGGTQYAEDTASASGEQITMAGVVRKDSPGSFVDTDGDRTELQVNANGALRTDGSGVTQPVSAASLPLPTGAATEATLANISANQLPSALVSGRLSVVAGPSLNTIGQVRIIDAGPGGTQQARVATGLPSISDGGLVVRDIPTASQTVDDGGFSLSVDDGGVPLTINLADGATPTTKATVFSLTNSKPLATRLVDSNGSGFSPATEAGQTSIISALGTIDANIALIEAATDGLEAELADKLDEATFTARINTQGQKVMASSTPVVLASDQSVIPVSQSGTWTVQPGNTQNTTPWLTTDDWRRNSTPKRYSIAVNLTPGAATAGTNLMGLRKLNANADVYILRIRLTVFHAAAGVACVLAWARATTVAGGSQIAAADIPKMDTAASNATLEVRTGAVTGTEANQKIIMHPAHSTAAPAASVGSPWIDEWSANDRAGAIRLTGDEGLILEQFTAGDTDNRYQVTVEWEEA